MASFVECSIRNRLSGDRLFDTLDKFIQLYEETDKNLPERDALILGTTPNEIKILYSRDELKIHEILCKYALKTYLKTVFIVLVIFAIVCWMLYTKNEFTAFAMGPLIVFSLRYTRTCKDWLFQDKQKNRLKQNATKEEK